MGSIGSIWLKKIGVPQENIQIFCSYLNTNFEKQIRPQIVKKFIISQPNISLLELKENAKDYEGFDIKEDIVDFIERACPIKNKKEKLWVQKIYKKNLLPSDVRNLLLQYNKQETPPPLEFFISLEDLKEYLVGIKRKKPIDSLNWEGEMIEMFFVESQEEMDYLGAGTNWCTLGDREGGPVVLNPFEFYLFKVNGMPEVLFHPKTQELKDCSDGPIYDGWIAKMIYPFLDKYKLIRKPYSDDVKTYFHTTQHALNISNFDSEDLLKKLECDICNYNFLSSAKKEKFRSDILDGFCCGQYKYQDFCKLSYGSLEMLSPLPKIVKELFEGFVMTKILELKKEGKISNYKRLFPKSIRTRKVRELITYSA